MLTFNVILVTFLLFLVHGSCDNAPSVIIIGAGPAGIAAASRLLENGISNITVLEAEGRIGGRIHSVKFGDAVVDLGAQWCHGEENNVVYEMVKDLGLLEASQCCDTFVSSSHENVDQNFAQELYTMCEEIYYEDKSGEEISLGQYITEKYNKRITSKYGNDTEKLKFAQDFLNTYKGEVLSLEGAFSWFDPAAMGTFEECEGDEMLNWKGRGYKTILDVLMKNYPEPDKKLPVENKIVFNKEVIEIEWDNNTNDVTVRCSDNSVYTAAHVILTVSLGVLKDRYETLFSPSLPQEKINAIKELGIGAVAKVFFHFPCRWWTDGNITGMQNGHSWLDDLSGLFAVEHNPNVLLAWFTGEFVPQIELLSDDTIMDGMMFVLDKFVGRQFNICKPDAMLRHSWYANPHFQGVYSFETVKSRKRPVPGAVALLKPLISSSGRSTLLFAGEATNPIHYATVHGAIETGYREADRIIKLYK